MSYLNYEPLWFKLKVWAKEQAATGALPTLEECAAVVREISHQLLDSGSLREDAIAFYAAETAEMVQKMTGSLAPAPASTGK